MRYERDSSISKAAVIGFSWEQVHSKGPDWTIILKCVRKESDEISFPSTLINFDGPVVAPCFDINK